MFLMQSCHERYKRCNSSYTDELMKNPRWSRVRSAGLREQLENDYRPGLEAVRETNFLLQKINRWVTLSIILADLGCSELIAIKTQDRPRKKTNLCGQHSMPRFC